MPFANHNGLNLHYQELGQEPAAGERSPVVMLHGLFVGSLATWFFTAAPALAATRRVLAYDLRGHGLSERASTGYDLETMQMDLEGMVARVAGTEGRVSLVGHSYGAVVALRFAIAHPGRVERLALVEAPLPPSCIEELDAFRRERPEAMLSALPRGLAELVTGGGRRARRLIASLAFLATETSLLRELEGTRDLADAELAAVQCPVLCVYGDRSSCLPAGRRLVRVLPHAELAVLPGGHFLPVEAPGALTDRLIRFFDG